MPEYCLVEPSTSQLDLALSLRSLSATCLSHHLTVAARIEIHCVSSKNRKTKKKKKKIGLSIVL